MSGYTKPKALQEGATIGIAASSSPFSVENFHKGVEVLGSLGFKTHYNEDILSRKKGYLAGSDEVRAAELSQMLSDPDIDAVMFARGGYGVQRIMSLVDFSPLKTNPKPIVGYSDVTALLSYLTTHLKMTAFYGPVVCALASESDVSGASLKSALTSDEPLDPITSNTKVLKEGEASGRLLGGCISMIESSVGTDYGLKTDSTILFLEDFNEKIYKYDRMLVHLKNSGMLEKVSGIVFGSMGLTQDETQDRLWKKLEEVLEDFEGPVVYGLSVGHISPFLTLPLGVECNLNTKKASLSFKEAALL